MKAKFKYLLIVVFIMAGFSSCKKFLDVVPDNVATIENAFSDKYTAEKYLTTCYSYLPEFGDAWGNPTLLGGDEIWYPDRLNYNAAVRIARGEQNITDPLYDYWTGGQGGKPLYEGIRVCNTFLEKIGGVKDLYDYERIRWVAEVNFLKAYYHYYLIRMYGPMHITDKSMPVSATTEAIKIERQHVDSCFNYVVRLLDKAIPDLPLQIQMTTTELGRITKPIAASIKARVLMTAASPLFNGNPDYATFTSKDNETLFSTSYDETKWTKAALACKEAIDLCHDAGFALYKKSDLILTSQINDSLTMKLMLRSRISERWNKEIIWSSTGSLADYLQYE
ncbi:MAG: RagB/SusD family nutrient uptake outer membrane protein, partial [Bacteroidota bacterium]|nr:RagB/SusD family nutrient uptake outer membrane protein [Bacteroidota bacterium]